MFLIVLMNLLIAIISDNFEKFQRDAHKETGKERASFCLLAIQTELLGPNSTQGPWLIISFPKERAQHPDGGHGGLEVACAEVWQGRLKEVTKALEKHSKDIDTKLQQQESKLQGVCAYLSKVELQVRTSRDDVMRCMQQAGEQHLASLTILQQLLQQAGEQQLTSVKNALQGVLCTNELRTKSQLQYMHEAHAMELLELRESFQQHRDRFNDLMQPMVSEMAGIRLLLKQSSVQSQHDLPSLLSQHPRRSSSSRSSRKSSGRNERSLGNAGAF